MKHASQDAPVSEVIAPRTNLSVGGPAVDRFLGAVRRHLGMDIAFISQFREHDRVFRHVDADGASPICAGDSLDLDEGYCLHVVQGRLPELIADTSLVPMALSMPATAAIPIGSHLSVPIRLSDGSCYGTFCCFSFDADRSLGQRDLEMMRVFADLLAEQIDRDSEHSKLRVQRTQRIRAALAEGQPAAVYQPIYNLATHCIAGFECLARFRTDPPRPPNEWFLEASEAGLGPELEIAAIRAALRGLEAMPAPVYLTVNCSPATIADGALLDVLQGIDVTRVVAEITEHVHIEDYTALLEQLTVLRSLGMRVAIDDAGAGYASMRHILKIRPDLIKLDISLTQNIDTDPTRRALAAALIAFAGETDANIVAEGVETEAELNALKRLGIFKAQGFYLGRPVELEESLFLLGRAGSVFDPRRTDTWSEETELSSREAGG